MRWATACWFGLVESHSFCRSSASLSVEANAANNLTAHAQLLIRACLLLISLLLLLPLCPCLTIQHTTTTTQHHHTTTNNRNKAEFSVGLDDQERPTVGFLQGNYVVRGKEAAWFFCSNEGSCGGYKL